MSGPYSLVPNSPEQLQSAATTGTGGVLLPHGRSHWLTVSLQSNGTTSGGTISIEEARYDPAVLNGLDYTGTWSVIQAVSASTFTGGAQVVVHVPGSFWAVRARISSNITGGGSVDVWAWCN